ncbi:hypothetical protein IV99_07095 [Pectobacterium brasiliense]|nr:hypothetical protein IV99_07095 [Pectobacterium brasiliense]
MLGEWVAQFANIGGSIISFTDAWMLPSLPLNLSRLDPAECKGSRKVKRIIAASSDKYCAHFRDQMKIILLMLLPC